MVAQQQQLQNIMGLLQQQERAPGTDADTDWGAQKESPNVRAIGGSLVEIGGEQHNDYTRAWSSARNPSKFFPHFAGQSDCKGNTLQCPHVQRGDN